MKQIKCFKGKYEFLSNFYPCMVTYEGSTYPNAECAYQASKSDSPKVREFFEVMSNPMEARRWGNKIQLKDNWDETKNNDMYIILKSKFENKNLRDMLVATGDSYLEEGNTHGDKYWGTVKGEGQNNLGKLLMKVRKECMND